MRIDAVGKETTAFCYFLFNLFLTSRRFVLLLFLGTVQDCILHGGRRELIQLDAFD